MSTGMYSAGSSSAASSRRILTPAPEPNSISRARGPTSEAIAPACCPQEGEFGTRRVVFRQLADAVEQARAYCVVEELARQRLRRAAQAAQHGVAELVERWLQVVEPRERMSSCPLLRASLFGRSRARRMPVNCQRPHPAGRSCGRSSRIVRRPSVAQEPPRRTNWLHHKLAVVLAQRASFRRGIAGVGECTALARPLPHVAEHLCQRRLRVLRALPACDNVSASTKFPVVRAAPCRRAATSHSHSVGSRAPGPLGRRRPPRTG